jgi:hypothetical protein
MSKTSKCRNDRHSFKMEGIARAKSWRHEVYGMFWNMASNLV